MPNRFTPQGFRRGRGNYIPRPPKRGSRQVQSSAEVKSSPWGGGGFVDYGGAFVDSLQAEQDFYQERKDYEKRIKDEELRELDADFGRLVAEPSGAGGVDAAAETMARGWKQQYVQAKRDYDKGLIDPAEFSQLKNNLFNNAKQFNTASQNINTLVNEYDKAVQDGTVSDSTPPEIRDILDTLRKGGESLTVSDVNGIPTIVGTTNGGQQVSVPISEIASGKNVWRFNEKFDTGSALSGLYSNYEKLKVSAQQPDGSIVQRTPSWEELGTRVSEDLDHLLNNQSTVRAIAGDEMGIDALQYEEMEEENPDLAKLLVKNHLMEKLQNSYYPTQQIAQRGFAPQRPAGGSASATALKQQQQAALQQENLELLQKAISSGDPRSLIGRGGITDVSENFFGGYEISVGDTDYDLDLSDPKDQQILANLMKVGNLQQGGSQGGGDYTKYL